MPRRAAWPWDQRTLDRVVLLALLVLAAVLRLVDLPARGTWDADQGNDMLVLRGLVLDGRIPLLGPPTSIGDFHHGVLYYYLLSPAAWLTSADPTGVVAAIALSGVAAVGVTWWLARSIGGSIAGAAAGLLMAVSASAVDESTFIWNPNLIALTSSVALAGAWRAWTTRKTGWWIVAGLGTIATMHCHVLGTAMLPVTAGLLVADWRRRTGPERSAVTRAAAVNVALLLLSYVPLAIHELTSDFSESRSAVDFITGGGEGSGTALPIRFLIVVVRVLAWPLTGLITDAPAAALIATGLVIVAIAWRLRSEREAERAAVRWLGLGLLWSTIALTFGASGLATVIHGLPNDHYHAFADPMVFVLVGLGVAALARLRQPIGAVGAAALVVVLAGYNLANQPPARVPDGGWPAARNASERILAATGNRPIALESLPTFKPATAMRFPLAQRTSQLVPTASEPDAAVVVLCDDLFRTAIGAPCGGEAEERLTLLRGRELADRFEAAPGRWVSVYLPD
ncbi:MAG TPA: hypothetical protein VF231_03270 [Candidatus Limnocylindrales bacterium]